MQLVFVADHLRQSFLESLDDFDAVVGQIIGPQLQGTLHDPVELHRLTLLWHLARKTQQVLDDQFRALRLLDDDIEIALSLRRETRGFQ